jgi:hypothetical protein
VELLVIGAFVGVLSLFAVKYQQVARAKFELKQAEKYARKSKQAETVKELVKAGHPLRILCGRSDVGFHGNDQILVMLPNTVLWEPRAVRYSFRASSISGTHYKGISFYTGSSVTQSESTDELRQIGRGDFIITNKRVVFISDLRTYSIPFKNITATSIHTNGIRINKEDRQKPLIFWFPRYTVDIAGNECDVDGSLVDWALIQAVHAGRQ